MKKIYVFLLSVLFLQITTFAQITSYTFAAQSGTYTAITGTTATVSDIKMGITGLIPIGFTFRYNGIDYTNLGATVCGAVRLGSAFSSVSEASFQSFENNIDRPIIAVLWDQHSLSSANGLTYQVSGSAPNRVFTLQWAQVRWTWSQPDPVIEFQLKLFETTNRIEFIYNQLPASVSGAMATIGICAVDDGSGTYLALTNTSSSPALSSTYQNLLAGKPATGQVYSFSPPTGPCTAPPTGGTTITSNNLVCQAENFSLSVSGASSGSGLSYQWQYSTDGFTWQNISGALGNAYTTNQYADRSYRRAITCSGVTSYSTPVAVATTIIPTPTITASGPTTFCQNGSVTLTSSSATHNQWIRTGDDIPGATGQTYSATQTGYFRVRIDSGGCSSFSSVHIDVIVHPNPSSEIIASGSTSVCEGNTVTLTSVYWGVSYQWQKDGVDIAGATSNNYAASTSGSYTMKLTNNKNCTRTSNAKIVTISTPATPVISAAGPITFCQGSSVELNTTAIAGLSYQWKKDGAIISGATSNTYAAISSGSYTVQATNSGNCSEGSNTIAVTVDPSPATPTITVSGSSSICQGSTVVLTSSAVGYNQWHKDGIAINGAVNSTYSVTTSGNYTVSTTNTNCGATSAPKTITVSALPAKPTITATGNILTSSSAANNQWFLNGVLITGATNRQYNVQASGLYSVTVSENDCNTVSEPFNFVATGIVDPATWNNQVITYPNPVVNELTIINSGGRNLKIQLVDALGRYVQETQLNRSKGIIDMKQLQKGIYWILITDQKKKETITRIIVKQ